MTTPALDPHELTMETPDPTIDFDSPSCTTCDDLMEHGQQERSPFD